MSIEHHEMTQHLQYGGMNPDGPIIPRLCNLDLCKCFFNAFIDIDHICMSMFVYICVCVCY